MDLGNVMALGNLESEQAPQSDPVTAAAAASISLNPSTSITVNPPPPSKPVKQQSQQQQHIITSYAKGSGSSHLTQLNTVTSNSSGPFSVVSTSGGAAKTIVVVPVSSNNSSNPGSGDASQPVLKKVKLTTSN